MNELGKALLCTLVIGLFFGFKVYPDLEYSGVGTGHSCYGECYEEYVAINGTVVEIEQRKKALANADEFSSIRSLWAGCAACHGQEGQGMAVFPALAGQTSDYIVERLYQYKNKEQVGGMSSTMWAQAGQLTDEQIKTLGKFIEVEL
jgi:cytochrome c553